MNIWLKDVGLADGVEFYNVLKELSTYEHSYETPVMGDFDLEFYKIFIKARVNMAKGKNIPSYSKITNSYWVMKDNIPVGFATLVHKCDYQKPGGNFSCWLLKQYQHEGIGTIVSDLLSDIAYHQFGLTEAVYTSKKDNIVSQKSLEKIGAEFVLENNGYYFYKVDLSKKFGRNK